MNGLAPVALVGLASLGAAPLARADESPFRTSYAVPAECPSQSSFEARVQARTPLAHFDAERGARDVQVTVRAARSKYEGHLSLGSGRGGRSERAIVADRCEDVVDALAVVMALAIDPNALLSTKPPEVPAVEESVPPAVLPAPQPEAQKRAAPTQASIDRPPARPLAPSEARTHANAGAALIMMSGVAPDALLGASIHAELERTGATFAPSARVGAVLAANSVIAGSGASFFLRAARVEGCVAGVRWSGVDASLRACVDADVGSVRAEGAGASVARPYPAESFWLDVAAIARARWAPVGRLYFELEAGFVIPITEPKFVYRAPLVVVQQVQWFAGSAAVGAGLRFW